LAHTGRMQAALAEEARRGGEDRAPPPVGGGAGGLRAWGGRCLNHGSNHLPPAGGRSTRGRDWGAAALLGRSGQAAGAIARGVQLTEFDQRFEKLRNEQEEREHRAGSAFTGTESASGKAQRPRQPRLEARRERSQVARRADDQRV